MPKPNDRIGPFQLINRLGKGTFGEVWLAQTENAKSSPVALKLPNDPDLDFDALLQEAIVWARAGQHPNVVEFLAARVFDHQAVIVSEYVPDGSLEQWLKRNGGRAPSIESAIEMTCGILDGLGHLHSKSIIHRDLKPANILMQGSTPRLADFGHSRVLASTMHSSVVAGTPPYMAPEAFDAVRDKQTDVWSVGVLLYQMLAGRMPFPQRDASSLMKAILMHEPQPLPADLPAWLRQAVEKAMSKDTATRYQSAAEMRAALFRSAVQPIRETQEVVEPVKRPVIPQPVPDVEQRTIERGKVMVDLAPKPEPLREPKPAPLAKSQPTPVRPNGLRPAVKWGGAGVAAIVIALATYLATKTPTPIEPDPVVLPSPARTQPLSNLGDEFTENLNGVKLQMKRVPSGSFLMGSPENESDRSGDEGPQHRVTVPSFYMGKYEVTQAQWKAVMSGNNPSNFKGDDLPVERISWNDAKAFCEKLSRMSGKTYRLPSEAEWEYACRAGTTTDFAFGDSLSSDQANFDGNYPYGGAAKGVYRQKTTSVGSFSANKFGLFDMHGNVWEWCQDVWHDNYNGAPSDGSAWLSGGDSSSRVLRGGSWGSGSWYCRAASRSWYAPGGIYNGIGFRVVSARTP